MWLVSKDNCVTKYNSVYSILYTYSIQYTLYCIYTQPNRPITVWIVAITDYLRNWNSYLMPFTVIHKLHNWYDPSNFPKGRHHESMTFASSQQVKLTMEYLNRTTKYKWIIWGSPCDTNPHLEKVLYYMLVNNGIVYAGKQWEILIGCEKIQPKNNLRVLSRHCPHT